MRILFLHPDLGIGGAERLVVDAAVALKKSGHEVAFLTNHHDMNHCFTETRDGTLYVRVVGDWFPRQVFGRCKAACAFMRFILLALYIIFVLPVDDILSDPHVLFVDQISAAIPLLKWLRLGSSTPRIIFYGHFPDVLLSSRDSLIKRIYRFPLDWLEEVSTRASDVIVVNSKFTERTFRTTFKSLKNHSLKVIYPSCHFSSFDRPIRGTDIPVVKNSQQRAIFLSINRFERKKNLGLVLQALAVLQNNPSVAGQVHVIIAGGYDDNLLENKEYYEELVDLAKKVGISEDISFMKSPDDETKRALIHACRAVIYTPENEHFGIVPLEGMYMKRPVIACNSGGPLETIADQETGFLCEPTPEAFAEAMLKLINDKSLAMEMGEEGRKRVVAKFSYGNFISQMNNLVTQ